jgi:hypothetical protein
VLREKRQIFQSQHRAKCQKCGFEIFKSNLQVSLEASILLFILGSLAVLHFQGSKLSPIETGLVVLLLLALLVAFSLTAKLPDSAAVEESVQHKMFSGVVSASKWISVAIVALVFLTM